MESQDAEIVDPLRVLVPKNIGWFDVAVHETLRV